MKRLSPPGILLAAACLLICDAAHGQTRNYLKKPDEWYGTEEAVDIAKHILSHQSKAGSWPKNMDPTKELFKGDPDSISGTFDNGATTDELRFLARSYKAKPDQKIERALLKGISHLLDAQYPSGGWPQFHPPGKQYHRHITSNDGTMVRIMEFLREVATEDTYTFLPAKTRKQAADAFDHGVLCILKCQIRIDGGLAVWCAQHDEIDLSPRPARAYELASLSGSESVGIVRLLMSLEKPSAEVKDAIHGAVAWLDKTRIEGIRITDVDGVRTLVKDRNAPDLWARFYDLETAEPLFADRDGERRETFNEISRERRNGYSWFGNWPEKLISKEYPEWKRQHR